MAQNRAHERQHNGAEESRPEIRDEETARVSLQAALTGHLVLATLHTNDAPSTVARLLDMGIESYLLSGAIVGVRQADTFTRGFLLDRHGFRDLGTLIDNPAAITVPLAINAGGYYEAYAAPLTP